MSVIIHGNLSETLFMLTWLVNSVEKIQRKTMKIPVGLLFRYPAEYKS